MTQPIIVPVILCGGQGTRLAPVSTPTRPKQFMRHTASGRSFLQMAIHRALICSKAALENIVIVTHDRYTLMVGEQIAAMGFSPDTPHIIAEPDARNTAAAICLAAVYIAENFSDDVVMLILPSDHIIENPDEMASIVDRGSLQAVQGKIVALGLAPTAPSSHYGYIKAGTIDFTGVAPVTAFVEKPAEIAARAYVRRGYLWNSGIFMARPRDILQEFQQFAVSVVTGVRSATRIAKKRVQFDAELYKTIPAVQYDRAIMEKTSKACVIPCKFDWCDIGANINFLYQPKQEEVTEHDYQAEQRSI